MSWQTVALADQPFEAWRNGGGRTRTLFSYPVGGDWDFRLSVAEVEQGGAFSTFAGVQRWFGVLAGGGVSLDVAGQCHTLRSGQGPLCFDGAAPAHCTLLEGPTQDLNLMLRQGRARGHLAPVRGAYSCTPDTPVFIALYSSGTSGSALFDAEVSALAPHTLAWRWVQPGHTVGCQSDAGCWWVEVRT